MDIFTVIVGGILALFMFYVIMRMSYVIMRNVIVGMEFRKQLARQVHALRLNRMLEALGVRILKVAMPWPVERETYARFADGLEEILVIEDKREQIENALRDVCYALPESRRPRIVGRRDEEGRKLVDDIGDLSPDKIARVLASRLEPYHDSERMRARIGFLDRLAEEAKAREALTLSRLPYFCSGCPHNTSTRVPEGSRAFGGVGCHFMANWMERDVYTYT